MILVMYPTVIPFDLMNSSLSTFCLKDFLPQTIEKVDLLEKTRLDLKHMRESLGNTKAPCIDDFHNVF